jgi:hypothetical protein
MVSQCISKLARSSSWSVFVCSLNHGHEVYLPMRTITASKCMSRFCRLWPPSVTPNALDSGLQVCMIITFKWISKRARSQSRSGSLSSLDDGHLVYFQICSIITSQCISISKMYFSHWKAPGVSERIWSVNLDASISGEYQTLGGCSCKPSE